MLFRSQFIFYGTREFTIQKDGHHIISIKEKVVPPFYQYIPIDFITEILLPFKIIDQHNFSYNLETYKMPTSQEKPNLENRANSFRKNLEKNDKKE